MKRSTVMIFLLLLLTAPLPLQARSPYPASRYPFAPEENVVALASKFPAPEGFKRVVVRGDSFGAWLRRLPLRTDRTQVQSFDGRPLNSPAAALIAIDTGTRDLQQCADSIIRLHAEFHASVESTHALRYHFTSGDKVTYDDWLKGERIAVSGSTVTRSKGAPRNPGRASLKSWLQLVFMYAGTRSLHLDSTSVEPADISPGDFFVEPGSPGHAVIVLDVAVAEDGRRKALLGQGFMPAQDMHVIQGSDGPWFDLPTTKSAEFKTPSWRAFHGKDARRFKE